MRNSFNAFGNGKYTVGGNTPIWLGTVSPAPIGGVLASAYAKAGAFFPAGTPCNLASGVLTPLVLYKVKSVSGNAATVINYSNYVPSVGDSLKTLSASGSAGNANEITAISYADNGDLVITLTTAVTAGKILCANASITPNGYLYNDIAIATEVSENVAASGAVVKSHAEGVLIDRTPAAEIAAYMATNVPNVIQVNG